MFSATRRRAFTMIELMFVVVILGILFGVVLPRLTGGDSVIALRTTANQVARLGSFARQSAISLNQPVVLSFHKEERVWYLSLPPRDKKDRRAQRDWDRRVFPDPEDRIPGSDEEFTNTLHRKLDFKEFRLNGEMVQGRDPFRIWFYPNGTAEQATIVLTTLEKDTEDAVQITVEFERSTGLASAYEGEPKSFAKLLEEAGVDPSAYAGITPEIKEVDAAARTTGKFGVVAGGTEERKNYYADAAARIMANTARKREQAKQKDNELKAPLQVQPSP